VAWFIEAVVRNLNDDVVYIIAGDGKEHQNISVTVANNELQNRVFCLGAVSEKAKEILFCTADIFVQPNIKVKGDMEGFGLVVLEAASYGLVVVASRLEGLKDAIHDGKNGILMKERDAKKYKQEIEYLLMNDEDRRKFGMQARKYVAKHFSWENSARKYMNIFEGLISNSS
jgi:glycosyltransferase involved in cell wall biosynthesis